METLTPLELYRHRKFGFFTTANSYDLKEGYYRIEHEDGELEFLFVNGNGEGTFMEENDMLQHRNNYIFPMIKPIMH